MFVKHVGSSHPAQTTLYWPSKNTVSVEVQLKQLAVYSVAVRQTEALTIRRATVNKSNIAVNLDAPKAARPLPLR